MKLRRLRDIYLLNHHSLIICVTICHVFYSWRTAWNLLAQFTAAQDQPRRKPVIPDFPEFKLLELTDRADVEAVVHSFPPYSDFSFTNMYAWNAEVSLLNGNLVMKLADYVSGSPFFSFIGRHRLMDTASQLLDLATKQYQTEVLRLVPACTAQALANDGFTVATDEAATDYVFDVNHVAGMHEWTGHSIRRRIRQFAKRYPHYSIRHAPLHAIDTNEFRALFALWAERKGYDSPQASHEYPAFERFLSSADPCIETVGLYVDSRLVGFSSFELLPDEMAIVHFSKADHSLYGGICDVLYWEEAKLLKTRGVRHYNWEQDLGLLGLQQSKKKYQPCQFLKKFTVCKTMTDDGKA